MPLGILFWVIYVVAIVFGVWSNYEAGQPWFKRAGLGSLWAGGQALGFFGSSAGTGGGFLGGIGSGLPGTGLGFGYPDMVPPQYANR